ncbi:MAG: porin [Crocinitomicaceae bacterium]|nr:porin [Crocinitomicaceae bacterium]
MRNIIFILSLSFASNLLYSAIDPTFTDTTKSLKTNTPSNHAPKEWYQKISLKGYTQVRYNRFLETNPNLVCEACDRSVGNNQGIYLRRARLVYSGQIHQRVYIYTQIEMAQQINRDNQNFGQLRDAYMDLGLDNNNEFRVRLGLSKVPYGFTNMQSSQNRLALDRDEAINSGVPNERDMGAYLFYTPLKKKELFKKLVSDGLKGTGDYGIFAFGYYNGQSPNKPEENNGMHVVGRFTYPVEIGNQVIEAGVQGFTGAWTMPTANLSSKSVKTNGNRTYKDERVAGSFVLYPKPFGIQFEYNVGSNPKFNGKDSIVDGKINGFSALVNYRYVYNNQVFFPFVRYSKYTGGKKLELDARYYEVTETEFGIEWEPVKQFELTIAYNVAQRLYSDMLVPTNTATGLHSITQAGKFLRIQAQFNF